MIEKITIFLKCAKICSNKNGLIIFGVYAILRKKQEANVMDTSIFDNIYSKWSEEIPDIIQKSIKDILGEGSHVDEELVNSWVNLLL